MKKLFYGKAINLSNGLDKVVVKVVVKVVASFLICSMVVANGSLDVSAASLSYNDQIAISKIKATGVMEGTNKGFEPDKNLTRAEAVVILLRLFGEKESRLVDGPSGDEVVYSDVPKSHWAYRYIYTASGYGLVSGVGSGKFAPSKEINFAEFTTMVTRLKGPDRGVVTMMEREGNWPDNYMNFAAKLGITKGVNKGYRDSITRRDAAVLSVNTLEGLSCFYNPDTKYFTMDKIDTLKEKLEGTRLLNCTMLELIPEDDSIKFIEEGKSYDRYINVGESQLDEINTWQVGKHYDMWILKNAKTDKFELFVFDIAK